MFGFTRENVRFCVTVKKAISQMIIDHFQINAKFTEDSDEEAFLDKEKTQF